MEPLREIDRIQIYHNEKVSTTLAVIFFLLELAILADAIVRGISMNTLLVSGALVVFFLCFYSYSVAVYRNRMEISYGIGWIKRVIPMGKIESFYVVSNSSLIGRIYYPFLQLILEVNLKSGSSLLVPVPNTKAVMDSINNVRLAKV